MSRLAAKVLFCNITENSMRKSTESKKITVVQRFGPVGPPRWRGIGFELQDLLTCEIVALAFIEGDEPMELFSDSFVMVVERDLEPDKLMIIVVQAKLQHPLVKRIIEDFRLVTVTEKNGDDLAEEIASEFASLF